MPQIESNGIQIEYDTFGKRNLRPIVLISGLVTQKVGWPESFCRMLVNTGYFVIRFDNRDVGLSTKFDKLGIPDLYRLELDLKNGRPVTVPYTLSDMAADVAGLLDGLSIDSADICGLSMGGMIAQVMALELPERVQCLVSFQSSTGEPDLPAATPEAMEVIMASPPVKRSAYVNYIARLGKVFAGGSKYYDEGLQREISALSYDRNSYLMGFSRQVAAIKASGGRREALRSLRIPARIIHGDCDPVVPLAHGRDTAESIPGGRLYVIKGLGHGIAFPDLWSEIVRAITDDKG